MLGLLFAFGLIGGMVAWSCKQAENPTFKRFLDRKRLDTIASLPDRKINLRGAEDALVLARRLGDQKLAARFGALVSSLRGTK